MNSGHSLNISHPELGAVEFRLSSKASKLRIQLRPFQPVLLTVPSRVSRQEALIFLNSRRNWIRKHQSALQELEKKVESHRHQLTDINIGEAAGILRQKTVELARKFGFELQRITVRRQRTRWGSCSSRGNISLNLQLINLPEHLRDYVILHELLHTRIRNHGPIFWEQLENYLPAARTRDRALRNYRYLLYI